MIYIYFPPLQLKQITAAPFGLEHPSQFFLESRKIRGGMEGVKQEVPVNEETTRKEEAAGKEEFSMDLSEQDIATLESMDTF